MSVKNISWDTLELVIFDVDGTLYDQKRLRRKMLVALIKHYLVRPWRYRDLLILYHFRNEREKRGGAQFEDLYLQQFVWCAEKMNVPVTKVAKVIEKWMFNFPNRYLGQFTYPGIILFFNVLKQNKILTAIYSDYESADKLNSMGLRADIVVSSTDEQVNTLKPLPNGLNYIMSELDIKDKNNCLFIGDRDDLDGACSRQAGIPFLLVDKLAANNNFYEELSNQLIISAKK
ncbi:HAD family hydrolase [Pedobacter hiemivivus]|uniref:phosphoglycolate phosphatase n=1 Tax=Pedobacter hiemivivus TaxID=2530454 RepID=A0A4U1G919_9SPHI|nr:HAD family hydrolase [Pedobacter hiemivivus]TKC59260.1 HAD family hydrolase [Pedobacter hiemivivus]